MHRLTATIELAHTDAAGVLFHAEIFRLTHAAFEDLMARRRFPLSRLLQAGRVGLPLVHIEADFKSPLRWEDRVTVELTVEELGARHFSLAYRIRKGRVVAATARTVQVAVATATGRACALPAGLRRVLAPHLKRRR